jgi:hypothetical protein
MGIGESRKYDDYRLSNQNWLHDPRMSKTLNNIISGMELPENEIYYLANNLDYSPERVEDLDGLLDREKKLIGKDKVLGDLYLYETPNGKFLEGMFREPYNLYLTYFGDLKAALSFDPRIY